MVQWYYQETPLTMILEHANLNVSSIEESVRFLTTAFPEFRVRGSGVSAGQAWAHVGTDLTYLALNESPKGSSLGGPLNHLGYVVDDVDTLAERLQAAGYREGFIAPQHPYRKRRYFHDSDDIEWEFVEYMSTDPAERNDYRL
jgi:catechol 2,3-dioxygenase-like lactoylglutathione lyase family enzyme